MKIGSLSIISIINMAGKHGATDVRDRAVYPQCKSNNSSKRIQDKIIHTYGNQAMFKKLLCHRKYFSAVTIWKTNDCAGASKYSVS